MNRTEVALSDSMRKHAQQFYSRVLDAEQRTKEAIDRARADAEPHIKAFMDFVEYMKGELKLPPHEQWSLENDFSQFRLVPAKDPGKVVPINKGTVVKDGAAEKDGDQK